MDGAASARVWYVAYGSNLCRDRLMAYLEGTVPSPPSAAGGVAELADRASRYGAHRGCSDPTPPAADRWLEIEHRVTFRGRSPRWDGGVAFLGLDPEHGVRSEVRAWSLTVVQVLGLAGQEAGLPTDPEASRLDALTTVGATAPLGGGWYDTLLRLPDVDGRRAVTVTTGQDLPITDPTEAYLATIAAGRAERPDLHDRDAALAQDLPAGEGRPSRRGSSG